MRKNGSGSTESSASARSGRFLRRQDILLIVVIFIAALIAVFFVTATRKQGEMVQITVDGTVAQVCALKKDATIPIEGVDGENVLVIKDGYADMTEADCPDKICVNHRPISKVGETIVCLPHKVVVEIVSGDGGTEGNDVDAVAN